jgi:hypothetical protein
MKRILLPCIILFSFHARGQKNAFLRKETRQSRFTIAKRVIKNSILSAPGDFSEMVKIVSKIRIQKHRKKENSRKKYSQHFRTIQQACI